MKLMHYEAWFFCVWTYLICSGDNTVKSALWVALGIVNGLSAKFVSWIDTASFLTVQSVDTLKCRVDRFEQRVLEYP